MLNMKKQIFYISNFSYIQSDADIDIAEIPPLIRRKLSLLDKAALTTICRTFSEHIDEIIFTSEYGELSRLETIIEQYSSQNEVSPAQFSASVHNYLVGFFALYKNLNVPYFALSAGENSVSAGLVKSVISSHKNILFSYADVVEGVKSASCIISPESGEIKCRISNGGAQVCKDEFENFIDFMNTDKEIFETPLIRIERV